jgi:hypothetical protein
MPALIAVCPKCNNDAPVPEEAIGKKVKCKKCQTIFVIEPLPTGKLEKPGPKQRPKTKAPPRPEVNSEVKASVSGSGGMRRPAKKSNAILYIVSGVVLVGALGAIGAAWYLNQQPTETPHAKSGSKDRRDAKARGDAARRDEAKKGDANNKLVRNDSKAPREPRVDAKAAAPDFKPVEAPVAPLLKSTNLTEVAELGAVRQVYLFPGKTARVGVRIQDKGKSHFDTYDLDRGLRVGHFEIPNDAPYVDIDPEGNVLACFENEKKHISVYELPGGSRVQDDWRPYDDIKDQGRFLGDGDYAQFAVLSKDRLLVLTSRNAGDIWDISKPGLQFRVPGFSHEEFKDSSIAKGHDSALSADRNLLAFATDEGIEFLDTTTGTKVGKTPKLSKFGPKVDVQGIAFDPQKKSIAAYISFGKTVHLARFQVPSGEPIGAETVTEPGDFANLHFVGDNLFLACEHPGGKNRDANRVAGLLDLSGQQLVECVFSPRRMGMFSTNVRGKQVAFAYLSKDKPSVGIVEIPMPGTTPAGTSPPETASGQKDKEKTSAPLTVPTKGSLFDRFKNLPKTPAAKDSPTSPSVATVRQERWEFGVHGIAKKGETK